MEKILLRNSLKAAGARGHTVGVHFRHNAFNPDVLGASFELAETVQKRTFRNLFADALDFYKLFPAESYVIFVNRFEIDLAVGNFSGGIDYVF